MFDRVQVRALAGSLKDIQRLVLKPHLCCLGFVPRVFVLLEDEPSPQSEVLCALEQVFIKDLYFAPFIFPSILTSLPVPAAEKHPHSMMLTPPCFTVEMVPGFLLPQICLGALRTIPSTSWLGFCFNMHRQLWVLI